MENNGYIPASDLRDLLLEALSEFVVNIEIQRYTHPTIMFEFRPEVNVSARYLTMPFLPDATIHVSTIEHYVTAFKESVMSRVKKD